MPALLFLALGYANRAGATAYTWTNAGGDNLWSNAANWSPNGVPNSAADDVTFNNTSSANCTIDLATTTVQTLTTTVAYGGVISLGSNTLSWKNGFTVVTASQFNAGTGLVRVIGGAFGNPDPTFNTAASFYNLEIACGVGDSYVYMAQNVTVTNNLTITTVSVSIWGSKTFFVGGNLANNTNWVSSGITIRLNGTGTQTYSSTVALPATFQIAKPSGYVQFNNNPPSVNVVSGVWNLNGQSVTATGGFTTSGGTITGTGTLNGNVSCGAGGISTGNSPGCLTINGNLSMTSTSTLTVDVLGTTACTDYDQIVVNGTVSLGNATLASGSSSPVVSPVTIIDNNLIDEVSGTFSGKANNSSFCFGANYFTVNYAGGTGNDVVLTPGSTPEADIQGNGTGIADGDVTPSTGDHTDFGSQSVCSGTVVKTYTIQNTGSANLTLLTGSITLSGANAADFSVSGISLPATVAAGSSTTFTVTFNPSASGTRSATVNIASNDCDEAAYDFAVQGTGIDPEIDVQGNSVTVPDGDNTPSTADHTDFGNVAVNGSLARTFTIFNTGNADLTVGSITSSNPTLFTIGALTPASPVAGPGGSATFTVTFLPTAAGVQNATITVNNSDCDEAVYDFAVTGKGAVPGAALDLSGSSDYVTLSGTNTLLDGATQFTIEHWIKSDGVSGVGIVGKGNTNCCVNTIHTGLDTGGKFFLKVGNQDGLMTNAGVVPTGTWVHLAAVYDGSAANPADRIKIYANGVLQTGNMFGSIPATAPSPNVPFVIGGALSDGTFNSGGQVDEVRIWNTALTCDQVWQRYNCELTGSEPNLMAYYQFNQGFYNENNSSVTTLTDVAGGDNNGTLLNFALSGATSNWVAPGGVTTGTSCPAVITYSEINVQGNSTTIADGDNTPSTADHTDFNGAFSRTFTIQNTGTSDLTTSVTSSNTRFVVSGAPASVAPNGGTASFTLTYNPTDATAQTSTITVSSNDCDEATYDFVVTATAVAAAALDFDGVNDHAITSTSPVLTGGGFTVEFWAKRNGSGTYDIAVSQGVISSPDKVLHAGFRNTNQFTFALHSDDLDVNASYSDNNWHHWACVYTGPPSGVNNQFVYRDGVLVGSRTTTGAYSGSGPLYIGTVFYALTGDAFSGLIDEVRVWNRGLCQAEIQNNMNCELPGGQTGLLAYYQFNQGFVGASNSGVTTLTDASGNANNGTLTNFALSGATSNWTAPGGVSTGSSCTPYLQPEINLQGGSPLANIIDGDNTPSSTDHTDFGNVAVNGSLARTFTIFNTGNSNLTVGSITSSNPTVFTIGALTPASPVAGPGGSATFTVTFLPTAAGVQSATITINSDDCDEATYDFTVQGTGATPAAALHFDGATDGSGDFVSLGTSSFNNLGAITISAWIKPEPRGATGYQEIWSKEAINSFSINNATGKLHVNFGNGTSFGSATESTTTIPVNGTWTYVAATRSATGVVKVYINGVLESTGSNALTGANTNNRLIGSKTGVSAAQAQYKGAIDELRIWSRELCPDEIQQWMNCELNPAGQTGLSALYRFNQGFANENNSGVTTLTDATGNGNTGTLTNFALTGAASNWIAPGGVTTGNSCSPITPTEINVQGNSMTIADGDATPTTDDHTDFGNVAVNNTLQRTFTIQNTGSAALTVGSITSSNSTIFAVGALSPASPIPAGQSASFTVTFAPTALGIQNATITVNNSDCDEAVYDFAVTGKGAVPGAALHFDGVNDYISTPNNTTLDLSTQTVEFWAKPTGSGDNDLLVGKRNYNGLANSDVRWSIHFQNGNQGLYFYSPAGYAVWTYAFTPNQWYHIAMVTDATSTKLYIDGTFISSQATTINTPTNLPLIFGASAANFEVFPGSLDELRIWNVARTCDQINQLRNCELTGSEPNLVAYYKFNQGFANEDNNTPTPVNTLTDATANANNGTLNGFALNGPTSNWVTPGGVTTGTSCPVSITYPEINVQGNSTTIADGDITPSTADHTDFNGAISRTFTIQNTGTSGLTTSVTSSNTRFVVSGAPASVAPNGGTASFTLTYNPTDGTAQTSTITVSSNDCDEATYDFVVTATATAAKALNFDGVDDDVIGTSPTAFWGTVPTTIEFWLKKDAGADMFVGDLGFTYQVRITNGALNLSGFFLGNFATANNLIADNTWTHCAITYDGLQTNTSYKAYINGQPVSFTGSYSSHPGTNGQLRMGLANNNYRFKGSLDEVRIWKEARSAAAILANLNSEIAGMNPCLDIYWKFNHGFVGANNSGATSAADAANTVVTNGVLSGFALTGATSNWAAGSGITETASAYVPAPEVNVKGGAGPSSISDGDATPSAGDGTNFGSVAANSTVTKTFTIENTGNLVLNVSGVTISGANAADFSVSAAPAALVAATTGTTTFSIQFAPTTTGTKTAVLHVNNDDCDEADYDIAIQGTATCVAPAFSACPANQSVNVVPLTCAAPATYTATATGAPAPTLTYAFAGATTGSGSGTGSGESFNKGVTNVVVTATNGCTPAAACSFTVTVTDNEKPQITCAGPMTINTTAGLCTGTTTLTEPAVTDNCPFGGNGLNFDGNDDRVATAAYSGTGLTGDLTLECWFKGTSMHGRQLIGRGYLQEFDLALWSNQLTYYHGNGSSYTETNFSHVFADNAWHHVAVVRNATAQTVSLYVNGVFQQTLSYVTPLPVAQTAAFRIGNRTAGNVFLGTIDEVRVWTTARTAGEIAANWNRELAAQPGLFALYHLNEGSANGNNAGATTAADASGNANAGTLTNFALSGTTSNWGTGAFGGVTNNAPATYPKGATTVTWTATDAGGNTETCQQTVTVTDNQAPVLTSPGNQSLNVIANTCAANYTIADPVTDNCTGATWGYTLSGATAATVSGIADGSNAANVSFNLGVTTVTLTGTDGTNAATTVSFTVTVNGTPPTVTCPADQTVSLCGGAILLSDGLPAGGAHSGTGVSAGSFDPASAGTGSHPITYTYDFAPGCSNSCTFNIRVSSPEMDTRGLGQSIADGDNTPATADNSDFGGVLTGHTATHTFTIVNSDPALPLHLTGSPRVSLSGSAAFTVSAQPATPVAAGNGTSNFSIAFNPASTGLHTATVSIANDDCDEDPYTFTVQGRGAVPPSITVQGSGTPIANRSLTAATADHTDFGSASVSGGAVTRTFTIGNIADGLDLVLNGMPKVEVADRDAADFTVTVLPVSPVAGGGSVTFEVTFDPSAAGLRTAILIITHNDLPQNPFVFTLNGTGL